MHQSRQAPEPLRLGPFQLDLRARELRKDGQRVPLQDKPFELLAAVVERPGEIISRDELRHRLWPADTFVVFDDGLNTAISKARDALGDQADTPRFIETVPRRGYRYIGPIDDTSTAELESKTPAIEAPVQQARPWLRPRAYVYLAATATVLAAAIWAVREWRASTPQVVTFHIQPPPSTYFPSGVPGVAISPDGSQVAFVAVSGSDRVGRLWLQSLHSSTVRPLAGTEGASETAWSPDGQALAFRRNGQIARYDLRRGTVELVCEARNGTGLSWGARSDLLFASGPGHGLYRVAAEGGVPAAVTTPDAAREETMHTWPQWLPDGRSFLYVSIGKRPADRGVYLGRLGDPKPRLVVSGSNKAQFTRPGFLVYSRDNRIVAQRFDPATASLSGAAVEIATDVHARPVDGGAGFSVASTGVLAYSRPARHPQRELVWVNPTGQPITTVGAADAYASFYLSPNGRFVVLQRLDVESDPPAPELWLLDLVRGVRTQLTNNPGNDEGGVWASDSQQFLYARHPGMHRPAEIYLKRVSDPEKDDPLLQIDGVSVHPFDWSTDGRFILFGLMQKNGTQDIWVLPRDPHVARYPWLATASDEAEARFSPDGKWVAYEADEDGRREVFVRSFDPPGSRWRVSAEGGRTPQWSRDGKTLYFKSEDHRLMAVRVNTNRGFTTDAPQPLFELRRLTQVQQWGTPYAVSTSNQRFLVGSVVDEGGDSPITVVLNWTGLLPR